MLERDAGPRGASIRNFGFVTVSGQERSTVWPRAQRSRAIWQEVATSAGIADTTPFKDLGPEQFARVYAINVGTGQQSSLGRFDAMTFSPRYSPDGGTVVMSEADGGGSDIIAVSGGASRRLTNSGAIDVSPCFSPDGARIVFASDRGGDQQIYIMGAGGGTATRVSFGSGRYGTPVWSPRGDLIAFTRYAGDTSNFSIGVMRPDGSGERILADGWLVEGPTFAPNGRVLMFWRETRGDARGTGFSARLYSIDVTGFNEQPVPTPTDATDPAWSPLGT